MKKFMVLAIVMVFGWAGMSSTVQAGSGGVESLRGAKELQENSTAPKFKKWAADSRPMQRAYVQQPPLVPHSTENYKINLRQNKCLGCHSWSKYKEAGATKISLTHFQDRFGNASSEVSPLRYFCTQCHAPQRDTQPLVENTFRSVDSIR